VFKGTIRQGKGCFRAHPGRSKRHVDDWKKINPKDSGGAVAKSKRDPGNNETKKRGRTSLIRFGKAPRTNWLNKEGDFGNTLD